MASPEREELLQKLISHRDELIAQVSAISEEAASTPPVPGEWSTKQQLAHVAHAERIYTRACRRVCAEDEPDLSVEWATPQGQFEDAIDKPIPVLLADIEVTRRDFMAALESAADEQFTRIGRKTPFGDLTLVQLLRSMYRHDRMHIDQIAGRQSSFQPRFKRS